VSADFFLIFFWWFLLFALGVSFLPFTFFIFKRFFDKGYAFAKIIAILIISYAAWLLGSLKILPFMSETVWLIIIAAAAANVWLAKRKKINLKKEIKIHWRIFAFEEILFFGFLTVWSFIRGYQPAIQGLEKFMDFGFVNSILRSRYFPPADMWLAGETINYYYFGHLISAVLTKISTLDSAITYNLMIATIFGLTFTAGFSLGANLFFFASQDFTQIIKEKFKLPFSQKLPKKIILAGLLTAFLLTLGSNLHPLCWRVKHGSFKTYWYPDATRFIVKKFGAADNTIHEFPLYSFVVADLHGHMINIPNVLLILALVLNLGLKNFSLKKLKKVMPLISLLSLCLAIAFMTNAWDYPIYLLVTGGSVFLFNKKRQGWNQSLSSSLIISGLLVPGGLIFSLPFHLHFKNIAKGISLVDFHSPAWMLLVLWGLPFFTTAVFLILLAKRLKLKIKNFPKQNVIDLFVFVFLTVSWLLIFIPEVIYVKDIYIHSHQRANTVFKLTYQAFIMFSLATGYTVASALTTIRQKPIKFLLLASYSILFVFIFAYPRFAVKSFYGLKKYQGLWGLNYLKNSYPDDYKAILWLKKNVPDQPIIVEAVGESYTDFARVSANTGLPTILGWRVHEWLWRGSFDESAKRTEEVKTIYKSNSLAKTKELLNKYQVKFIFLGKLEKQQYPQLKKEKFGQLGEIIFSSGQTKIYKVN